MGKARFLGAPAMTVALAALVAALPARSEKAAPKPALVLELNAAQPSEKGCRLTFVITNNLGGDLAKVAFEMAMFNAAGVVDRLTVLDFKDLPVGKTKVARFELAGTGCTGITRLLINTATECSGDGIEPAACLRNLKTETKSEVVFGV